MRGHSRGRLLHIRLILLAAALLSGTASRYAHADVTLASFPTNNVKSSISMKVTLVRSPCIGMQQVLIHVEPTGTGFTRERVLTVDVMPRNSSCPINHFDFRQDITLPEGAPVLDVTLEVPAYYFWNACRVRVLEDGHVVDGFDNASQGVLIDHRVDRKFMLGVLASSGASDSSPASHRYPDCRALHAVLGFSLLAKPDAMMTNLTHTQALSMNQRMRELSSLAIRDIDVMDLPDSWTSYRQLDVLLASTDLLLETHRKSPRKFQEIRKWVTCGGCIWMYGDRPSEDINEALKIRQPWRVPTSKETGTAMHARFTNSNDLISASLKGRYTEAIMALNYRSGSGHYDKYKEMLAPFDSWALDQLMLRDSDRDKSLSQSEYLHSENDADAQAKWDTLLLRDHDGDGKLNAEELQSLTTEASFRVVRYVSGLILHIGNDDPFPGEPNLWLAAFGLSAKNIRTENRLGTTIRNGDSNYWNWTIGEVGHPPVFAFLTIITVFVLTAGPVAYSAAFRLKRQYLFIVFVPTFSFLCTAIFVVYTLQSDGFGTRVRVRQVTLMNDAGEGTLWQRHTYFAGLRPSGGAMWSDQSVVYPLRAFDERHEPTHTKHITPSKSKIVVRNGKQHFDGQFVPSREQSQFMIYEPRSDLGGIDVELSEKGAIFANNTPFKIAKIMVADSRGDNWMVDNLDLGESREATFISAANASAWLHSTYAEHSLKPPPGFQPVNIQSRLPRRSTDIFKYSIDGLAETALREQMMERAVLARGTFVAIANVDESAFAIEEASSVESVHFVLGQARISRATAEPNRKYSAVSAKRPHRRQTPGPVVIH